MCILYIYLHYILLSSSLPLFFLQMNQNGKLINTFLYVLDWLFPLFSFFSIIHMYNYYFSFLSLLFNFNPDSLPEFFLNYNSRYSILLFVFYYYLFFKSTWVYSCIFLLFSTLTLDCKISIFYYERLRVFSLGAYWRNQYFLFE